MLAPVTGIPTFLCDEMLKALARWLRAAGYDTHICDSGTSDRDILQRAVMEGRLLLTRDRKLQEFRDAPGTVVWLDCNHLDDCIDALTHHVIINWQYRPFSRCLLCNTSLVTAPKELYGRIPERSRRHVDKVLYCPRCDKLFWQGSHVRRMQKQLTQWDKH